MKRTGRLDKAAVHKSMCLRGRSTTESRAKLSHLRGWNTRMRTLRAYEPEIGKMSRKVCNGLNMMVVVEGSFKRIIEKKINEKKNQKIEEK